MRGSLRGVCSTSPILFNVYHQAVMRQSEEQRRRVNEETGIVWKWIPAGTFVGESAWEKECLKAKEVRITSVLFAGDTSVVARKGEMEECVRVTKEVMGEWEERNNEDKEENVEFGREECEDIRILGSWVEDKADVRNRLRRGGWIWSRVKGWLTGLLSKR